MAADHNDAFSVAADIHVMNASLQYANEYLDDVIGPLIDQSTDNLHLADEHLAFCEYTIENIARIRNDTHLALTSQLHFVCLIFDNKSMFSLLRRLSAWRYPYICCWAPAPAARHCLLQMPALSSKPLGCRWCCWSMVQVDERTDARLLHRPCSADYADSVNKRDIWHKRFWFCPPGLWNVATVPWKLKSNFFSNKFSLVFSAATGQVLIARNLIYFVAIDKVLLWLSYEFREWSGICSKRNETA